MHFFAGLLTLQSGNDERATVEAARLRSLIRSYYVYDEAVYLEAFLSGQIAEARQDWPGALRHYEKLMDCGPYFNACLARAYQELGQEATYRDCLGRIQNNRTIDFSLAAYWATRKM